MWIDDLSLITNVTLPALSFVTFLPAFVSVIVKPGPTVPVELRCRALQRARHEREHQGHPGGGCEQSCHRVTSVPLPAGYEGYAGRSARIAERERVLVAAGLRQGS